MNPRMIVIYSGLFLMIVGVVLIAFQFYFQVTAPDVTFSERSMNLEGAGASANVTTTYVGLILVVAGAFLQMFGLIVGKNKSE